jgi:signal transduction histidine kinase
VDLWKLERNIYPVSPEAVDIRIIIGMIRMVWETSFQQAGASLELVAAEKAQNPDGPFYVSAERLLCCCLVDNLVANALDITAPEGVVSICWDNREGNRLITVHSPGVIPIENRGRLLEKGLGWAKSDPEGIRAYSARLMAEAMGGTLDIESTDTSGTIQTLCLQAVDI